MSDSTIKNNLSHMLSRTSIRFSGQTNFSSGQIRDLLKISVLNMRPQDSVRLVSAHLKLDDIKESYTHFWLADMLSSAVRNIQLKRFSLQQGTIILRWIVHFMGLVVAEEHLSKVMLFEKLRSGITVALENAGEYMIPLPDSTECATSQSTVNKNKVKFTTKLDGVSDSQKPMTAVQIAAHIANALHEMLWDDFKYTTVQMAFNTEGLQKITIINPIKDFDPLHQRNDSDDLQNEDTADKDNACCAIMDRYFFRAPKNPSSDYDRLINSLKQSMCRRSRLYVSDDIDNNEENVLSAKN